jgi:hypothetical protein
MTSTRITSLLAVGAVVALVSTAWAADRWDALARQCAAEIAARTDCGSCSADWPYVVLCMISRGAKPGTVSQARVQQCIAQVGEADANDCFGCKNRIGETMQCLGVR